LAKNKKILNQTLNGGLSHKRKKTKKHRMKGKSEAYFARELKIR
jgi:hypothetical protein